MSGDRNTAASGLSDTLLKHSLFHAGFAVQAGGIWALFPPLPLEAIYPFTRILSTLRSRDIAMLNTSKSIYDNLNREVDAQLAVWPPQESPSQLQCGMANSHIESLLGCPKSTLNGTYMLPQRLWYSRFDMGTFRVDCGKIGKPGFASGYPALKTVRGAYCHEMIRSDHLGIGN